MMEKNIFDLKLLRRRDFMRKTTICIIVLFLCFTNIFASNLKIKEDANVRAEPSAESEIIEVVSKDSVLPGILSEENGNWFHVSLSDGKNGFIHKSLVDETVPIEAKGIKRIIQLLVNFIFDNIALAGIIALVIWVIAIILSKTTKCVIVYNWYDLIILLIPGCIFSLYVFKEDLIKNDTLFSIIFIIAFCISVLLSILGNFRSKSKLFILNILVSAITKLLLVVLAPIVILAFIGALTSGKKDGRFRDGTRGNTKTLIVGIILGILAFIILPLVKTDEILEIS